MPPESITRSELLLQRPQRARALNRQSRRMHPTAGLHDVYSLKGRLLVRLFGAHMVEHFSSKLKTILGDDRFNTR